MGKQLCTRSESLHANLPVLALWVNSQISPKQTVEGPPQIKL